MAKKKAGNIISGGAATSKAAAKAAKKAKAAAKVERKEAKKVKSGKGKGGAEDEDDQDLEGILERVSILIGELGPTATTVVPLDLTAWRVVDAT
jgi:hypothetical protein